MDWLCDKEAKVLEFEPDTKGGISVDFSSGSFMLYRNPDETNCSIAYKDCPPLSLSWSVTLQFAAHILDASNNEKHEKKKTFTFSPNNLKAHVDLWRVVTLKSFCATTGKVKVKLSLRVVEMQGFPCSYTSAWKNRLKKSLNGVVVIRSKEIAVSKDYLSLYSSFFDSLFNSNFKEKQENTFELQDVNYDEFVCLMKVLYGLELVNESNYRFLLKLSDRYDLLKVKNMCECFMVDNKDDYFTSNSDKVSSLLLADQYNLSRVMNMVIIGIESLDDLKKIAESRTFEDISPLNQAFIMKCCLRRIKS